MHVVFERVFFVLQEFLKQSDEPNQEVRESFFNLCLARNHYVEAFPAGIADEDLVFEAKDLELATSLTQGSNSDIQSR